MKNSCILGKALLLNIILFSVPVNAAEYSFSIVPQQSPSKTAKTWGPVLSHLSKQTGHTLKLKTYRSIPEFENALSLGHSDLSYMNPYHYTVFHERSGYQALAKAKNKRIKGILVVKKDSPIQSVAELEGTKLAFPSPAAFAASILPRGGLGQQGIQFNPTYVGSHDSSYLNVAQGRFAAGGGVMRTFNNMKPRVRDKLRILHTTQGYTPHAVAAHSRVPTSVVQAIQKALLNMDQSDDGRKIVKGLKVKGWEKASNSDWDDVRALSMTELSN